MIEGVVGTLLKSDPRYDDGFFANDNILASYDDAISRRIPLRQL